MRGCNEIMQVVKSWYSYAAYARKNTPHKRTPHKETEKKNPPQISKYKSEIQVNIACNQTRAKQIDAPSLVSTDGSFVVVCRHWKESRS